jgi:hypothetical protein
MGDNLSGVEALLFDVFGTVVDWKRTITNALAAKAKERGHASDEGPPCTRS